MVDLQLTIALSAVALAASYLGRRAWKTWKGRTQGCSEGCHGPAQVDSPSSLGQKTVLIPKEEVVLRRK